MKDCLFALDQWFAMESIASDDVKVSRSDNALETQDRSNLRGNMPPLPSSQVFLHVDGYPSSSGKFSTSKQASFAQFFT
jgi:hypothetical protein